MMNESNCTRESRDRYLRSLCSAVLDMLDGKDDLCRDFIESVPGADVLEYITATIKVRKDDFDKGGNKWDRKLMESLGCSFEAAALFNAFVADAANDMILDEAAIREELLEKAIEKGNI